MTKANEISILRSAIDLLGDDSYCGPWLESVLAEVEATIRSDYFPTVTMAESEAQCKSVIEAASENAKGIVEVAKSDAAKIMDRAERYRSEVENAIRLALRNLSDV